jgi:hypothetical protein
MTSATSHLPNYTLRPVTVAESKFTHFACVVNAHSEIHGLSNPLSRRRIGRGLRKIASALSVGVGTVQRINRELN